MSYVKKNILPSGNQFEHFDDIFLTFKEDGTAIDISDYIFTMEFRDGGVDGTLVKKLILTAGELEVVDISGTKKLKINKFALDTPGKIYYDVRMKDPATGKVKYRVGGVTEIMGVSTKQDN